MTKKWTKEQENYLIKHVKGKTNKELAEMINVQFKTNYSVCAVSQKKHRLNVISDFDFVTYSKKPDNPNRKTLFKKGHIPHNKGVPMSEETRKKCERTWFHKGNITYNTREKFSERIGKDGFIQIKVDDLRTWKAKQVYIWEQAHGKKVGKMECVIFLDGNKRNFAVNNLEKVTRAELCKLNQIYGVSIGNAELTKTHLLQCRILLKRCELARKIGIANKYGQIPSDAQEKSLRYRNRPEVKEHLKKYAKEYYKRKKNTMKFQKVK